MTELPVCPEGLTLEYVKDALTLKGDGLSMSGDYSELASRIKKANLQNEMLVKAARIKSMPVPGRLFDATAGMGEDSLILAAAGFYVTLYEYNPIIYALLKDTVDRASHLAGLAGVVPRMDCKMGDSISAMKELNGEYDVILLDPMFPKREKSALIKKKFQLLQQLEMPCMNEDELFDAAISAKPKRIVVKRPLKGPYLANRKPDYSLEGKAIRYDCYNYV